MGVMLPGAARGPDHAGEMVWKSRRQGTLATRPRSRALVESLVTHSIACEFGNGNIHFAAKRAHVSELKRKSSNSAVYSYDQLTGVDKKIWGP